MATVRSRQVGVIGAGGSGIAAATALRRAGLDFEVLEARDGVGGTWRYDPTGDGSACYASLVTNTSKLRTSMRGNRIGGRPWEYARHGEMLEYLERIVAREQLQDRIRLGWRVTGAEHDGHNWVVRNERGEERRYDALVCALGVNGRPRWGDLDGEFLGEQMHSASYRTPEAFADRDVLVLGMGTSGCEVAGEAAATARSVRVAVRSPTWMMTRRMAGLPIDWLDNPVASRVLPWGLRRRMLAGLSLATTKRLRRHGVPRPTRRPGDDIVAISDTFPAAVRRGLVDIRPGVESISGNEVRFADGTTASADVIVHATGFDPPGDFLASDAQPAPQHLYRGIAHAGVPDLHFVGLIEAHRALLPIAEGQAAWSADVLAGRVTLPDSDTQAASTRKDVEGRMRAFGSRHPYLVDYARYLAKLRADRRAGISR
jgi:dimethylaniline monooxygenase (N-oxide forming)